jgi:hypothetical protein
MVTKHEMSPRKPRDPQTQDRQVMDMSSQAAEVSAKTFLDDQADEDRTDAKASHANKGLKAAKELLGTMTKAVAHGLSSENDSVKQACLDEVAELGNACRDACRAAIRSAKAETRNVQD